MEYLAGAIGFAGFEGLRIYKKSWDGKPFPQRKNALVYVLSAILVGGFSSYCAGVLAPGNMPLALYIGFSIPTSAKEVLSPRSLRAARRVSVDDIAVSTNLEGDKSTQVIHRGTWLNWFRFYFGCKQA